MTSGEDFDPTLPAGSALAAARSLLLDPTPRNIAACRALLAGSVEEMERLLQLLRTTSPRNRNLIAAARRMRLDAWAISTLLETGIAYHSALLKRMADAAQPEPGADPPVQNAVKRLQLDA